ncbi:MAG: PAS domain S-box protein [Desulfobacteraceae bacterium]
MQRFRNIHSSLSFRLIFWVGLILLVCIAIWAYFDIRFQKEKALNVMVTDVERLGNTIKLGTHYAMMLNSRDDITQITKNIARQREIENIRIYNKEGQIKFSNSTQEIDQMTNIKAEACFICHKQEPPLESVSLSQRKRLFDSGEGYRKLGIISPIYNEPGCSPGPCHVHPQDKKVLGLLDVVISMEGVDKEILAYEKGIIGLAISLFLGASTIIGIFLMRYVNRPIKKLITGTRLIGNGDYDYEIDIVRNDEIGQLAHTVNQMRKEIRDKYGELKQQRYEYQKLFEGAPCYITVQDRDLKIIRYNREFAERFRPKSGDYCYTAYKGRSERCEICPVIKTFEDGQPHYSEEAAVNKDGTEAYWMVRTSPIKNAEGEVIAAMEMSLDLTHVRFLEREAQKSEEKYRTIFNTIPNPVFVLDGDTLKILDCNDSVTAVYGFHKEEILMSSFTDFFEEGEREEISSKIKSVNVLDRARQIRKDGMAIYVNIRVSMSEYSGQKVFLVTTSDITMRLMAEQQLIQASKMATLGEMATGVAHELNQPLSVIKTASSFLKRKVAKKEAIEDKIMQTMAGEIDSHVDRASKIITHMREFGRKSEVAKEKVQVNGVLKRALELFSQQLKLREIEVIQDLEENLPVIWADSNRLEQVFVNLLINARDAIEKRWEKGNQKEASKRILLRTQMKDGMVTVEVTDTGTGIPESILDKIFEPFFTTKNVGKGTGLGLSISYGIVQDYDGIIKVNTEEGEGTTFIVQFPVPDEA